MLGNQNGLEGLRCTGLVQNSYISFKDQDSGIFRLTAQTAESFQAHRYLID